MQPVVFTDRYSHSDISISQSLTFRLCDCLAQRGFVERQFVIVTPEVVRSRSLLCMRAHLVQNFLHPQGELNGEIHVRGLFETASSLESVDSVTGTGYVCHIVVVVETFPGFRLIVADKLKTVITDKDRDRTALSFVSRLRNLERRNGGDNDLLQCFLINRQPDRNMWQLLGDSLGGDSTVEDGVSSDLSDGSKDLPLMQTIRPLDRQSPTAQLTKEPIKNWKENCTRIGLGSRTGEIPIANDLPFQQRLGKAKLQ
jgi:hypothetical protein